MGQKVHPVGFRLGFIRDWQAKWYADKHYAKFLHEDLMLRGTILSKYSEAGISSVEIDRQANEVSVTIRTARPGIVIGRGGQRVNEMRALLERLSGKRIRLNIEEIRQPELDACLVAKSVAEQIQRRVAYRRAMKQAVSRTIQGGAKGIKITCAGRLAGAEIARSLTMREGRIPLHTLRADIDYGVTEAHTALGRIGVKAWIYKGDILPEPKWVEAEIAQPVEAAEQATPEAEEEAAPKLEEEAAPKLEEEAAPKLEKEAAPKLEEDKDSVTTQES
ncbi:30S ribosomal protein S3 [Chloroflexota bacterium]